MRQNTARTRALRSNFLRHHQVLFKNSDMDKQGKKLMKVLGIAVTTLRNMNKLAPILQNLGRKHVSYGVTAEMYPSVGEALLLALEKGLGDEFTPEAKEAWGWMFGNMSTICIEAAKEVDPNYGEAKYEEEEATAAPVATISSETEPGEFEQEPGTWEEHVVEVADEKTEAPINNTPHV